MTIPTLDNILIFASMAAILFVIPGPAVLYITAKSLEKGYKMGFISVLGIGLGALVHVAAVSLGLSAILLASPNAFTVLKYSGACYLIFLGIKKLVQRPQQVKQAIKSNNQGTLNVLLDGMIINILNPKTAIFFLAFLPQFVSLEKGHPTSQILFLGLIFIAIAALSNCTYVLISGEISSRLQHNSRFSWLGQYGMALVYFALGIFTLFLSPVELNLP